MTEAIEHREDDGSGERIDEPVPCDLPWSSRRCGRRWSNIFN
jgi:hypothetical protein